MSNIELIHGLDLNGPVPDTLQQGVHVQEIGPHIVHSGEPALCLITVIASEDLKRICYQITLSIG